MATVRNDTTLGMAVLVFQGVEEVAYKCRNTTASLVAKMVASGIYASRHTGCRHDARPCGMRRAGMVASGYMPVGTLAAGVRLVRVECGGPAWDLFMQFTPVCVFQAVHDY